MLYFDNASTTNISENCLNAYISASKDFFNPSALYAQAMNVKNQIEQARSYILNKFHAKQNSTLIFTGSASESNNAVLASCITRKEKSYLIGGGEHSSVYETAKKLKDDGFNIQFIPLKSNGAVDVDALISMLDSKVAFVSIIHVSNETGAINDIKAISKIIKDFNPNIIFHSDGVQAVGKIDVNLKELNVDFYTMSAHKINGPKGVGALYIANQNKFKKFIIGGGQENGLRAGTENFAGIMAFKQAVQDIECVDFSKHKIGIIDNLKLKDCLIVSGENCVDNIISICFKNVRGETIEHMLETNGYLIGTGSACNSKAGVNRVLSTIVPRDYIEGAVRISFGKEISVKDCENLAIELTNAVNEYRKRINFNK